MDEEGAVSPSAAANANKRSSSGDASNSALGGGIPASSTLGRIVMYVK